MDARYIYDFFVASGMTRAGALGTIGNLMAESSPQLKSDIVQRGMTKLSDEQYTAAVDNGLLDFSLDHIGYGLAQWTYSKRKENLLAFAKACGASVGDGEMQVRFIVKEMKEDFPAVWDMLCTSNDTDACCDEVCKIYENPKVKNYAERRKFALDAEKQIPVNFYQENIKDPIAKTFPPDPTVLAFQMWMQYNGYWDSPITGCKNAYFFKQLRQFVDDMEKC